MAKKQFQLDARGLPAGFGFYLQQNSPFLWVKVRVNGKLERFSTGVINQAPNFADAVAARSEKIKALENRTAPADSDVVTIDSLMLNYYAHLEGEAAKRGEYAPATAYIVRKAYEKHLRSIWGNRKAASIGTADINAYRTSRLKERTNKGTLVSTSTVDHELGYIRSAMLRGAKSTPCLFDKAKLPDFKIDSRLQTANPRTGTITPEQYTKVLACMPEWLAVIFAYCMATGVRKKEARFTKRSNVDFTERLVALNAMETKKAKARAVGIHSAAWALIMAFEERTRLEFPLCPYLFHIGDKQIETDQLNDAWEDAKRTAGLATVRLDLEGKPVRSKNRTLQYDYACIWHDSRRTHVSATNRSVGMSETDKTRTAGQSAAIRGLYDQNNSAMAQRDAMDALYAPAVAVAVQTQPTPLAASDDDVDAQLASLKKRFDAGLIPEGVYTAKVSALLE